MVDYAALDRIYADLDRVQVTQHTRRLSMISLAIVLRLREMLPVLGETYGPTWKEFIECIIVAAAQIKQAEKRNL